jgi:hypothetical protein
MSEIARPPAVRVTLAQIEWRNNEVRRIAITDGTAGMQTSASRDRLLSWFAK